MVRKRLKRTTETIDDATLFVRGPSGHTRECLLAGLAYNRERDAQE